MGACPTTQPPPTHNLPQLRDRIGATSIAMASLTCILVHHSAFVATFHQETSSNDVKTLSIKTSLGQANHSSYISLSPRYACIVSWMRLVWKFFYMSITYAFNISIGKYLVEITLKHL